MKGWQTFEHADVVHRIAAYLQGRPDQADVLGYMRDDYVSELCIEAILASRAWRKRHAGSSQAEERYVHKSLWNYARTKRRSRFRRSRFSFQPVDWMLDPVDPEDRVSAREQLRALQKNLDQQTLAMMAQLAEAGGEVKEVWNDHHRQYNRRYFYTKINQVRKVGKKVLQN